MEIEPYLPFIWDVNGYYASLGVSPRAGRAQIRDAYQRRKGWADERLTYIIKILLDRDRRAAYDACQLGSVFFDAYVAACVKRRIEQELMDSGVSVAAGEDDLDLAHLWERAFTLVDRSVDQAEVDRGPGGDQDGWCWGWYEWQVHSDFPRENGLARWQELLLRAFSQKGDSRSIAVGLMGRHMIHPVEVIEVGNHIVVFLRDGEKPNVGLAIKAAYRVETLHKKR